MSEAIVEAMFKRANITKAKYKLILFDLDATLTEQRSIDIFAKEWKFKPKLKSLRKKLDSGKTGFRDISEALGLNFKNKTKKDVHEICKNIKLKKYAVDVIKTLKEKGYKVGIVSFSFYPIANYFVKKFKGVDYVFCPKLAENKGKYTGKVIFGQEWTKDCEKHNACKLGALNKIVTLAGFSTKDTVFIGDSKGDICAMRGAGFSIAINPKEGAELAASVVVENLLEIMLFV